MQRGRGKREASLWRQEQQKKGGGRAQEVFSKATAEELRSSGPKDRPAQAPEH